MDLVIRERVCMGGVCDRVCMLVSAIRELGFEVEDTGAGMAEAGADVGAIIPQTVRLPFIMARSNHY